MFRVLRKMRRDERGQAIVIGAVALLICAVMVMTSVSIGHGVYSKIKLQDAADAQSYSMAVKQARAYNFFAYTNRAMVVHYNAMLTFMSYVSHAYYLDTTIGNAAEALGYLPYIGPIFKAIEKIIAAWLKGCDVVAQFMIPVLTAMNIALWAAQEAMLVATILDHVTTSASEPVRNTDAKAKAGYAMGSGGGAVTSIISNGGLSALNVQNFLHPIDDALGMSSGSASDPTGTVERAKLLKDNKLSEPDMAKYRLLMGNIANSARREWTAVGKGPLLLGRKWDFDLCVVIGQLSIDKWADSQIKSFDEKAQDNPKDQIFASDSITIEVESPCLVGATVFEFDFHMQAAADNASGFHRMALNGPWGAKQDKHHKFLGITPYMLSDPSYINPWEYHFGYPCNTVVVTKDMIGGARRPFEIKQKHMEGQGTMANNGVLDMTWGRVGGDNSLASAFRTRTGGMMAMAVGRAIYHRPGDWVEEPNFFNPLWTARLAPMRTHYQWSEIRVLAPEAGIVDAAFLGNAVNY